MATPNDPVVYDEHLLNLMTNRVYDMPDVVVDPSRPPTINILVPAFDFNSISAGFFGVFQIARFIDRCGFRARLVMFDNFFYDEALIRAKLLGYPGMERLFDELEVIYIGSRGEPLRVSPNDNCVATVWYSAYFASKIMDMLDRRAFLYLIQDYEAPFYPAGALWALAETSYGFNYNALFSTKPLQDFFLNAGIGIFARRWPRLTYFNNACAAALPDRAEFMSQSPGRTRRLAFYSRPRVNRNMFELGALALAVAWRRGIFSNSDWQVLGVGLGEAELKLSDTVSMRQIERMNLRDYQRVISTFDVGFTLMASPHPSLLPFDLAGSGAVVVTNTFREKQRQYFEAITENIIAKPPTLETLVEGLSEAVVRSEDLGRRYEAARTMLFPSDWSESFTGAHAEFLNEVFCDTPKGEEY